ncbi:MAG: hypothetical protein QOJ72_462 [Nocardioidaceae bacterium]|jgi:hypothetical protein|nr:hypothetical protein [Nocardioidaceae bacterium]
MTAIVRDRAAELAALHTVQRRVAAIGFFAVAMHGVIGLAVVAQIIDGQGRHSDAMVLVFMSGIFALVTYVVMRTILRQRLWSPVWIVVSLVPTVLAAVMLIA